MPATDRTASEYMLPPVDTRSLVRRAALPRALAGAAVVAVVVVGGRVPAVADALGRSLDVNAGWVTLGVALEAICGDQHRRAGRLRVGVQRAVYEQGS